MMYLYIEKKYAKKLVKDLLNKDEQKNMHNKVKENVNKIFDNTLRAHVEDVLKIDTDEPFTGSKMKELLIKSSPRHFEYNNSTLIKIGSMDVINPLRFINHLMEGINSEWKDYSTCKWREKYSPSWHEIFNQITTSMSGTKPICGKCCPMCGSMCIHQEDHENETKCDCFHQPKGLKGVWSSDTGELDGRDCLTSLKEGREIVGKGPFSDFEKIYDGWKLPHLEDKHPKYKANAAFRKLIFRDYQKELANHYKKRECRNLPVLDSGFLHLSECRKGLEEITTPDPNPN